MKLYTDSELAQILDKKIFHMISEAADALGLECYVVGGYVRDIFLERPSNDIDVVVVGSGIQVAQRLKDMLGRQAHLSVFRNFGTAQVKFHDTEVEFVGARKESYSHDSRKPVVEDGGQTSAATTMSTTTVNIEENDRRSPVSYVLPPGVDRVVDPSNPQLRQLNEQAYSMKVTDLANGDARAVYKGLNMDFRNYRRLPPRTHRRPRHCTPTPRRTLHGFPRLLHELPRTHARRHRTKYHRRKHQSFQIARHHCRCYTYTHPERRPHRNIALQSQRRQTPHVGRHRPPRNRHRHALPRNRRIRLSLRHPQHHLARLERLRRLAPR